MFNLLIRGRKVLFSGKGDVPNKPNGTKVIFNFKTEALFGDYDDETKSFSKTMVVDDSKQKNKPMEMYIGKQFKFPLWEEWLEHMRVEEVSVIDLDWKLCEIYPLLSKSYRNFADPNSGDPNSEEARLKRSTHCCGLSTKTGYGYKDLDDLVNNPPTKLRFTLELLQVQRPEDIDKEIWLMNENEMNDNVPLLHTEGNELFAKKNYQMAAYKYRKALAIMEQLLLREKPGDEEWIRLDHIKIPLLSNLSQCELYLKDYYQAITHTTEVLEKDPNNVKALFRRAKAHLAVFNIDECRKDFTRVIQLDQTLAVAVNDQLRQLDKQVKEKDAKDIQLLKGKLF